MKELKNSNNMFNLRLKNEQVIDILSHPSVSYFSRIEEENLINFTCNFILNDFQIIDFQINTRQNYIRFSCFYDNKETPLDLLYLVIPISNKIIEYIKLKYI